MNIAVFQHPTVVRLRGPTSRYAGITKRIILRSHVCITDILQRLKRLVCNVRILQSNESWTHIKQQHNDDVR